MGEVASAAVPASWLYLTTSAALRGSPKTSWLARAANPATPLPLPAAPVLPLQTTLGGNSIALKKGPKKRPEN